MMRKSTNIAYSALIALWPILFVFGIDRLEVYISRLVSSTFDFKYNIWLLTTYAISGLIFAVMGFCQKESLKHKDRVIAHVVAGVLVTLLSILYVFNMFGGTINTSVLFINPVFLAFVLGYTMYIAVKAVVFYKKQGQ